MSAIRLDLKPIADRIEGTEAAHDDTRRYTSQLREHAVGQTNLRETCRHLEDLYNRGRRNNIRVRGVLEAEGKENLQLVLESIFNPLIGEPVSHKIKMDRAHRALRPKGSTALPRDIICCIHDFALKKHNMVKAKAQHTIDFAGASIQLYPFPLFKMFSSWEGGVIFQLLALVLIVALT